MTKIRKWTKEESVVLSGAKNLTESILHRVYCRAEEVETLRFAQGDKDSG